MERGLDYSQYPEGELAEMFGRMDPRYAPLECARLGKYLTELGYIVTQGDTGPGYVTPSADKLQALTGSSRPFQCDVEFGKVAAGPASYREPTHNDYGFIGAGQLRADGICVYLSGRVGRTPSIAVAFSQDQIDANSAGASGAVFGICGALLAALLQAGGRFPADIQRPTRNSTLLFVAWALYSSFSSPGIDYAAHIGGLAAGFALAWLTPYRAGHSHGG